MSFIKLQFKPGLDRDQTNYSGEGGWWECDKIRFRSGYPEKIGGWEKRSPTAFRGVCRQMWNWVTTYNDNLLALGTNEKLYVEAGGNYYNVTPLRTTTPTLSSPDTNNCITVSNGSAVVTVNLPVAHAAATGDYVQISGIASAIGGIPAAQINANHRITVIDGDTFTFTVATAATSSVANTGGTAIVIDFEITPGYAITTLGYGWGVGTWSRDAWGLGASGSPYFLPPQDWWIDNFDNDFVANIRNGAPYYWARGTDPDASNALNTRAVRLQAIATAGGYSASAVPVKVMQLMVSQQDKHLLAFGAVPFGSTDPNAFDPMLIRWADQDNPGQWTPTATNSAGDLRVSRGSRIIRALSTRQEILVWTDTHLYTLQFLGTTDVFALQEYADNISIASPRAMATASNITYWMGKDKFYAYSGRVETLPCTLRGHVFRNINFTQADQIVCGTNEEWNEIWWFYPTADSDWNNAYVVYNHLERLWYYGSLERSAWLDTPLRNYPLATNSNSETYTDGYLYNHEVGVDADGSPMTAYIQSNDFDLDDGESFMLTRRIIPDISFASSEAAEPEVTLEVRHRNFPGSGLETLNDSASVIQTTVDQYTQQVFIRARARQMAMKILSTELGVKWQLGSMRLDARADGKR